MAKSVAPWYWCWSADDTEVFYIQGRSILGTTLGTRTVRVLFMEPHAGQSAGLAHLVLSPDGKQLGYYRYADQSFNTLDLQSGEHFGSFFADHYFLQFVWIEQGIVYLDADNGERRNWARLMIFNDERSAPRAIAKGSFSDLGSLNKGCVIVRVGTQELWEYNVSTGEGKRLLSKADCESPSTSITGDGGPTEIPRPASAR